MTLEYKKLREDYDKLLKDYTALQHECTENTVLESMNDMRDRYNHMLQTTVSIHKYNDVEEQCNKLVEGTIAIKVLTEQISKHMINLESKIVFDSQKLMKKAQVELVIIKDIIDGLT
jgi:hypothetical protein